MHIALDCLVVGRHPSGVEQAVRGLLAGLAACELGERRFSVLAGRDFASDALIGAGFELRAAPAWTRSRLGRVVYEQAFLPGLLGRLRPDLVHGVAYVLPLRWRGPSVVTIHDTVTLTHPEWCKPLNVWHYRAVMTRSARAASVVVAPSRCAQRAVVEQIGVERARTRVVPLGVSEEFRPAATESIETLRERYRLPERYMLCVGNLEPRKNLTAVIEAFGTFAEKAPHGLVLAGKLGWRWQPVIQAIANNSVADRILWLDYVPSVDLPALYSGAEAVVQWSLDEGFGLAPLEAMACGTPAVISDGGALPEVAGEAALVVPLSAGPEGLAAELLRLAEHEELRQQLSERGLRHSARFTWRAHAERMMDIYEEVGGEATR